MVAESEVDVRPSDADRQAAMGAGALAGITGLLAFLIVHALWILPIWFIAVFGVVIAVGGGLAVGWSYVLIRARLPRPPWSVAAIVAVIGLILMPAFVLAELGGAVFSVEGVLLVPMGRVALRFVLTLLVTSTLMGALIGWWLGRTREAVIATAVAGFVYALGPGHNIPLIGGTVGVPKEIAIMTISIFVSSLTLVYGHLLLLRRGDRATGNRR